MKVILVAEGRSPGFMGGAETVIHYLSQEMVNRGHEVHTLTRKPRRNLLDYELNHGVHVHRYPGPPIGSRLYWLYPVNSFLEAQRDFVRLNGQFQFDVIIFNQPFSAFGILFSRHCAEFKKFTSFIRRLISSFKRRCQSRELFRILV